MHSTDRPFREESTRDDQCRGGRSRTTRLSGSVPIMSIRDASDAQGTRRGISA